MNFELGLYLPCNHRDPLASVSRVYPDMLEVAKFAEEIGFNAFAIPEHHFQEGLVVPSSLMMAVKVASMTQHARVRTAVIPLPIHHPLRLAGEIALADHLTEGRLEIGLARGSFEYTFRRFKMTMDQSRERFLESMDVLDRLLTETDVRFEGQFIHSVFTTPLREPLELLRKQSEWFQQSLEALAGHQQTPEPKLQLLTQVFPSKDRREIDQALETVVRRQQRAARMLETSGEVAGGKVALGGEVLTRDNIEDALIIGGPDEVIEGLLMRKQLGFTGVQLDMHYHLPEHAAVMRALELMRDEVLPEVLP